MNTNNRHSSTHVHALTPPLIIDPARALFRGTIDLDPASSISANKFIKARMFCTPRTDGLTAKPWFDSCDLMPGPPRPPYSVWLNPPGGWHKGKNGDSAMKRWWKRLLIERADPRFGHALFLSFSIEAAQSTQVDCERSILYFPTCFLSRRVAYLDQRTGKPILMWDEKKQKYVRGAMTHSSCVSYIAGRINRFPQFVKLFSPLGVVVRPWDY